MKHFYILIILMTCLASCSNDDSRSNPLNFNTNQSINLNLPQYTNLLVAGGYAYAPAIGNSQGVIIQNTGIGSTPYKAFERSCPYLECTNPMTFEGSLKMVCSCDGHQFSIIDGSELQVSTQNFAYEYRVTVQNSTSIRVSNF